MIYGRMSVIGSKADIARIGSKADIIVVMSAVDPKRTSDLFSVRSFVCHCHPRAIARMRIGLSTSNAMMAAAILRIAAT